MYISHILRIIDVPRYIHICHQIKLFITVYILIIEIVYKTEHEQSLNI